MTTHAPIPSPDAAPAPDPDLDTAPAKPLLAIDWATVPMSTDAEANAVWTQIAPTGDDWEPKLSEIPVASGRPLAIALLHGGNFTCTPPAPPRDCQPTLDISDPAPTAQLSDPCLRRVLALWAIAQLEDDDVPVVLDALRAIVRLPPPESQLVAAAIQAVPEGDHTLRLELIALAYGAGQRDVAGGMVGTLDEAHLIEAVTKHHIDTALDVLSAEAHRATYLTAIKDEAMAPRARAVAILELTADDDKLAPDAKAALAVAAKAKDCLVAAQAARALALRGDKRFVPRRPRTSSPDAMMRALCVLAGYEHLQANDEDSLLPEFVPPKGLELVKVAFDALAEVDTDGDGDPRTDRTIDLVPRADLVLPEVEDMIRAFRACKGTTCRSADRDFSFTFKTVGGQLYLSRLEVAERPSCPVP